MMHITVDGKELKQALTDIDKVIYSKAAKPCLRDAMVYTVGDDYAAVMGTDLELHSLRLISASVNRKGAALFDSVKVKKGMKHFKGDVSIDCQSGRVGDDPWCHVKFSDHKCDVTYDVDSADNFPGFPDAPEEVVGTLSVEPEEIVKKVTWACAKNKGRYALNGVLVRVVDGSLVFSAADGARLTVLEGAGECGGDLDIIVKPKLFEYATKLTGEIKVHANEERMVLVGENGAYSSKTICGNFPNYPEVIPTVVREASYDRRGLLDAVQRAHDMINIHKARSPVVTLGDSFHARNSGVGEVNVAVKKSGEHRPVMLNAGYLKDILTSLDGDLIMLGEAQEPRAPVMFTAPDAPGWVCVQSPVIKSEEGGR